MTFGGGTNEIQRDIIGYVGLGLPAAKRRSVEWTSTSPPRQDEAAELAATILGDQCTPERLRRVEADGRASTASSGAELGDAGLLALTLPEEHDGSGLGLSSSAASSSRSGATVAPVPLAAHAVTRLALAELRQRSPAGALAAGRRPGRASSPPAVAEEPPRARAAEHGRERRPAGC